MISFTMETLDGLPENSVGFPVNRISFMFEILPRSHFLFFHCEGCGLSRLAVMSRMQRKFSFVLKPCRVGYLLSLLE